MAKIESLESGGGSTTGEVGEEMKRLLAVKEDSLIAMTKSKEELESKCKAMDKDNSEIDSKCKALEKKLAEKDSEIVALKKKNEAGNGQAATENGTSHIFVTGSSYPSMSNTYVYFPELKALKAANENLEKEAAKNTALLTDIRSKVDAAKAEEGTRKEEMKALKTELKSLESRHRELQGAYDKLEEESNSSKEKLASSRKKCNDAILQVV